MSVFRVPMRVLPRLTNRRIQYQPFSPPHKAYPSDEPSLVHPWQFHMGSPPALSLKIRRVWLFIGPLGRAFRTVFLQDVGRRESSTNHLSPRTKWNHF